MKSSSSGHAGNFNTVIRNVTPGGRGWFLKHYPNHRNKVTSGRYKVTITRKRQKVYVKSKSQILRYKVTIVGYKIRSMRGKRTIVRYSHKYVKKNVDCEIQSNYYEKKVAVVIHSIKSQIQEKSSNVRYKVRLPEIKWQLCEEKKAAIMKWSILEKKNNCEI